MNHRTLTVLAALPIALSQTPPAAADVATSCSGSSGSTAVDYCTYTAVSPVGSLTTSGAVSVVVTCTVGGRSGSGLYAQAGTCHVVASFGGPGSYTAGGVPV